MTTYTYTVDGAVSSVAYTNAQIATPGVTWTYDPAYARVTSMVDGTGTTTYTYHAVGQLGAGQVATVDGPLANDVISYSYDPLGRVTTRAIDGVPLTLTYDTLGRVAQEVNALGTFTYGYDGATGRLATVTYPNGQTSTYSYFPAAQDHRLQTIHHKYPNGATLSPFDTLRATPSEVEGSKFDYTYDTVGNILTWRQQADASAVIWEYGYDNADQLTRAVKEATDPQGTVLQRFAYGYDPAGNRLFEQIDDQVTSWTYDKLNRLVDQRAGGMLRVAGSVDEPAIVRVGGQPATVDANGIFVGGVSVGTGTTPFTVTATDASGNTSTRTFEIDQAGAAKTFTFDANGNMTSDGARTFEWDARNQLVAVNAGTHRSEFTYDGRSRRVRLLNKENGTPITDVRQTWAGAAVVGEYPASGGVNRFFHNGEARSADQRFLTFDHLGSAREMTDENAVVLTRNSYDPYGRQARSSGNEESRVAYTGLIAHSESGLRLALYREYDSDIGRWLSEDPVGLAGGLNQSAYVGGNPVSRIDPYGLDYRYSQSGNTVTIDATITAYGPNASTELAHLWEKGINEYWNNNGQYFKYGKCIVKFNVRVKADPNADWWFTAAAADNYVYVTAPKPQHWVQGIGNWYGRWGSNAGPWEAAHEAGHFFDLPDDYNGRTNQPNPGHAGHMMAQNGAPVNAHEIADILKNISCKCQ